MTIKIRKLRYLGIIMAAAISMAGCANTTGSGSPIGNEITDDGDVEIIGTGSLVAGFAIEENDSKDSGKRATYPYVVRTKYTVWYLAADDIELMGEEAFFAGLEEVLGMVDQDFADARKALEDYISEEVQHIDYEWHDDRMKTHLEYRLLKAEWESMQK